MTRTATEIVDSIAKQATLAQLTNVEGRDPDSAAALGVPPTATVLAIRPEDFANLPPEDQEALIAAGYDLRSFVNTVDLGGPVSVLQTPGAERGTVMAPRIYVLRWEDADGTHYEALRNVMEDRCNLAAYACGQLRNIVAGSQPMSESAPSLISKVLEARIQAPGTGYALLRMDGFSMTEGMSLIKSGWQIREFEVDGQKAHYYSMPGADYVHWMEAWRTSIE